MVDVDFVPETLKWCDEHYVPPVKRFITCEDFGHSDGMNGSCHWCREMEPYQWHMCQDEDWVRGLLSPAARVQYETREDAIKYIEQYKYYRSNPARDRWAVVTSDRERAAEIITQIELEHGQEVLYRRNSRVELALQFADGVTLRWISPAENARGNRIGKMWCDKTVNREIFETVIRRCYMGKTEDIIWF